MHVLSAAHSCVSCDIEGNWAVVAALAEKTGTKEAANGKKYGIWCVAGAAPSHNVPRDIQ